MKKIKHIISAAMTGALCVGMIAPALIANSGVSASSEALLDGIDRTQYTVVEVLNQDFENVGNVSELTIRIDTANNVSIADDAAGTNRRDAQTREIGGIPSIEADESGNKHLRVSRRIANAYGIRMPIISGSDLNESGNGRYVLTFDVKAITTPTLYYNVGGVMHDKYFYEAPFKGEGSGLRFVLSGGVSLNPMICTAPGTFVGLPAATGNRTAGCHIFNVFDQWQSAYCEFDLQDATKGLHLFIWGANWPIQNVDYAIDNIRLYHIKEGGSEVVTPPAEQPVPTGPATNIAGENYEIQGIMFNLDDSRFSEPNKYDAYFLTREDALEYVDQYIDCHITDLAFCVNTQCMSMYPSEVWDDQLDEYAMNQNSQAAVWYRYQSLGIDPWQLWFERCWEKGVNPWISFRMDDIHGLSADGNITGTWFWENYAEYKRIQHRDDLIYRNDRALDFTHEAVRQKYLAFIEEAVNKYNVYGIELDWMRDVAFTTLGNEMAAMEMLNQFHRDIKAIVDRAEIKWGHEIKIGARVGRDIQTNIELGLDVITWCADGVLDVVIPSAYYMTDTEIPVLTWKKILSAYDVELYPNVSMGYISNKIGTVDNIPHFTPSGKMMDEPVEVMMGTAASYYAQGADKVYLYNLFGDSANPITAEHKIDTNTTGAPTINNYARWRMQTTLGSYAKLQTMTRRYVLTYQDMSGFYGTNHTQLPAVVKNVEKYEYIHFTTGNVEADDTVTLHLVPDNAVIDYSQAMKVFVNGKPATYIGRVKGTEYLVRDMYIYKFSVDKSVIDNSVMVEMTTTDAARPYNVMYAELVFAKS